MKKVANMLVFSFVMAALITVGVGNALSAEKMIQSKIESVSTKLDKNGAPYTRIIVNEQKELGSVKYTVGTAVMCFGSLHEQAKGLKAGQTLKAIVQGREYQGRTSYTLIAFVQ